MNRCAPPWSRWSRLPKRAAIPAVSSIAFDQAQPAQAGFVRTDRHLAGGLWLIPKTYRAATRAASGTGTNAFAICPEGRLNSRTWPSSPPTAICLPSGLNASEKSAP